MSDVPVSVLGIPMTASDMMDTGEGSEKVWMPVKYWRKPELTAALGSRITCMEPMEPLITTQPACTQTSITQIQTRIQYDAVASNFLPQGLTARIPGGNVLGCIRLSG